MSNEFANSNLDALVRRGYLFLEDGSWEKADEYFEKALDIFPECAEAYLGKLMAELKIPKKEVFKNLRHPFDEMDNYKKFIRFASGELKTEIETYSKLAKERNRKETLEKTYIKATAMMHSAMTEEKLIKSAEIFESISGYKDADELVDKCLGKAKAMAVEKEQQKAKAEKKKKRKTLIAGIGVPVAILAIIVGVILYFVVLSPILTENKYNNAVESMANGEYLDAIRAFDELDDYEDSAEKRKEASRLAMKKQTISAGSFHFAAVKENGKVVAKGDNEYGECDVKDWSDIVSVEAGNDCTVGIKNNGTVVATGNNELGQCNIDGWTDIVDVANGVTSTYGLRSDGTVVATENAHYYYDNMVYDERNRTIPISEWEDIIEIETSDSHIAGLTSDGKVMTAGFYYSKVNGWKDIVAIEIGEDFIAGLKKNGTVVVAGWNSDNQIDVKDWEDIVAISASGAYMLGLKSDGTVVGTGGGFLGGGLDFQDWKNIVAVDVGGSHVLGLKSDGTVVSAWHEIPDTKDIKIPE